MEKLDITKNEIQSYFKLRSYLKTFKNGYGLEFEAKMKKGAYYGVFWEASEENVRKTKRNVVNINIDTRKFFKLREAIKKIDDLNILRRLNHINGDNSRFNNELIKDIAKNPEILWLVNEDKVFANADENVSDFTKNCIKERVNYLCENEYSEDYGSLKKLKFKIKAHKEVTEILEEKLELFVDKAHEKAIEDNIDFDKGHMI